MNLEVERKIKNLPDANIGQYFHDLEQEKLFFLKNIMKNVKNIVKFT